MKCGDKSDRHEGKLCVFTTLHLSWINMLDGVTQVTLTAEP